jgi:hypothetical protein
MIHRHRYESTGEFHYEPGSLARGYTISGWGFCDFEAMNFGVTSEKERCSKCPKTRWVFVCYGQRLVRA